MTKGIFDLDEVISIILQRIKLQADKAVSKAIENPQEQVSMALRDNDV